MTQSPPVVGIVRRPMENAPASGKQFQRWRKNPALCNLRTMPAVGDGSSIHYKGQVKTMAHVVPGPAAVARDSMIRELNDEDAEAYVTLRREALLESPLAFASSPADDLAVSPEAVREQLRRAPASIIIGAFRPQIVGAVGLYRDRHLKSSHKAHIWGMYVTPSHRRQGIAAELLTATISHARSLPGVSWVHLTVSSAATAAKRLYERAGFQVWGTEPDALRHDGRTIVDYHMALQLTPDRR
jgi:RimJ/RimL family protein N-acetyltransferase